MDAPLDRSYRALLRVPTLGRVLISMQIARIAQSMVSVAIVLFTLDRFGSAAFAGFVTFASIFPGLLIAPLAGALLDRHGRIRLVIVDYAVALLAMLVIGVLAVLNALPGPLLVAIALVSSLTAILSHVGLRTLFPILVPEHLWERVNAVDSNGYVVATILGPPIAAALVAVLGGAVALLIIGAAFGIAALALVGVPEPPAPAASSKGSLLVDAWDGLLYTARNPTLRGLGFAVTLVNLANGMFTIVIPLIVLDRLALSEAVVGLVFAVSGISGVASAFLFGRMDTRGREWKLLVWPLVAFGPSVALLLVAAGQSAFVPLGLAVLLIESLIIGFLYGPLDIALFTVRQRRTDPAWMGRAFAVSMAFNFLGLPIGAALAGILAESSIETAILLLGVGGAVAATVAAAFLVPRTDPAQGPGTSAAPIAIDRPVEAVKGHEGP